MPDRRYDTRPFLPATRSTANSEQLRRLDLPLWAKCRKARLELFGPATREVAAAKRGVAVKMLLGRDRPLWCLL
jgi:hypothetical protein